MPLFAIDIEARFAQFQDTLTKIERSATSTAKKIESAFGGVKTILGAVGVGIGVGAIVSSFKAVVDNAEKAKLAAEKFGTSVESFSKLSFAAKLSNVEVGELEQGMTNLSKRMADAAGGGKESQAVFKTLGVDIKDAGGKVKQTDEFLREIAKRFQGFQDGPLKAALAVKVFGNSGAALIPLLNNMEKAEAEAKRLGAFFKTDFAKAASDFNESMAKLNATFEASKIKILEGLLPALTRLLEEFLKGIQIAGSFGAALTTFGLSTTASGDAGKNLRTLTGELEDFEKARAKLAKQDVVDPRSKDAALKAIDDDIAVTRKRIEFQKFRQQQSALELPGAGEEDVLTRRAKGQKPQAPVVPDLGALNKAEQEARRAAAALSKLEEDRSKRALDRTKFLADTELSVLEKKHAQSLTSEKEYWDAREKIQLDGFNAELKHAQEALEIQRKLAANLPKGSTEADRIKALQEVEQAESRVTKVQDERNRVTRIGKLEREGAELAYADELKRVSIELLEVTGRTVEALQARQALEGREFFKKAEASGEAGQRAAAERRQIEAIAVTRAKLSTIEQEFGRQLTAQAIDRERIALAVQKGQKTELQALYDIQAANRAQIGTLDAIARKYEEIAAANPFDVDAQLRAEQMRLEVEKLGAELDLVADKFTEIGKSATENFLNKLTDGAKFKDVKQLFKDLVKDINREISKIANKEITDQLFGKEGLAGGFGGFFADLFGKGRKASGPGSAVGALGKTAGPEAAFASSVTAAGTTFTAEVGTAGATFDAEVVTSAAAFAAEVSAAGAAFASTVSASSVGTGAASVAGDVGGLFDDLDFSDIFDFAEGGQVKGAGSGTSDSIPAMLSNNEFVVRAASVKQPGALEFLNVMNEKGLKAAIGSAMKKFATGGIASNEPVFKTYKPTNMRADLVNTSGGDSSVNVTIMAQDASGFHQAKTQIASDMAQIMAIARRG